MIKIKKHPFIIIGAGIAGLAAANKLLEQGNSAIILEGSNHVGGRIITNYSLGIPISLGAQWIHGIDKNPMTQWANQLSLQYKPTEFYHSLFVNRNKKIISLQTTEQFFKNFNSILMLSKKHALQQKKDISLLVALNAIYKSSYYSKNWNDLYEIAQCFLSLYTGASLKNLSAIYWDQEEMLSGGNHLMIEGFSPIVNQLAKRCDIRLNTQVSKITLQPSNIKITTNQGEFLAEKVIITVPLGVLKKKLISFEPDLPINKKTSIQKLKMGLLNSITLKFPKIFWPTDTFSFGFSEPKLDMRFFMNGNFFHKKPIITINLAGQKAQRIERLKDKIILEKVMYDLSDLFGKNIPNPSHYLITRWGRSNCSFGSYSYIPVGATGKDHEVLAESIDDKLFFAGEATHRQYPATVHGAYLSGIREAEHVLVKC